MKNRITIITLSIFSIFLLLFSILEDSKSSIILPNINAHYATTNFAIEATVLDNSESLNIIKKQYENIPLWGSWIEGDKSTGKIISSNFLAPTFMSLFVSGYPNKLGCNLYIENIDTNQTLTLQTGTIGEKWIQRYWLLPQSWVGKSIHLVAVDNSQDVGGWLGVSSPIKLSLAHLIFGHINKISALNLVFLYSFCFFLWLVPGVAILLYTNLYSRFSDFFHCGISLGYSAFFSYIIFWLYLFDSKLGWTVSFLSFLTFSSYLVSQYHKLLYILQHRDFKIPLSVCFLVGLLYLTILYIPELSGSFEVAARTRFFFDRSVDNTIPLEFAQNLYQDIDPRQVYGDWLSSDRPPLQSGIVLLIRPLLKD